MKGKKTYFSSNVRDDYLSDKLAACVCLITEYGQVNGSVTRWARRNCDKGHSTRQVLTEGRFRPSLKYT